MSCCGLCTAGQSPRQTPVNMTRIIPTPNPNHLHHHARDTDLAPVAHELGSTGSEATRTGCREEFWPSFTVTVPFTGGFI